MKIFCLNTVIIDKIVLLLHREGKENQKTA